MKVERSPDGSVSPEECGVRTLAAGRFLLQMIHMRCRLGVVPSQ